MSAENCATAVCATVRRRARRTSAPMQRFHNYSHCRTNSWQLIRAAGRAACARARFGCAGMRFACARICGRAQGSECFMRGLPNGRAGVDHTSKSCTTMCYTASRRRHAESARLPVHPVVGVRSRTRARCVVSPQCAQTDACPESSSAARNYDPMGLDKVDHHRQLQILAAFLPLVWMLRTRTVARTAVAQFSADMEVITCAHVHVPELKMLTCCLCMRSSIKHVDPCTGSLASPRLALSPSSSSTFGCAQESQSRPE